MFRRLKAAGFEHQARRAVMSEKGGVHEVGTVVFTVSSLGSACLLTQCLVRLCGVSGLVV